MKKVAITGPESTGKTTLAGQLAEHFQGVYVPEYARSYMANLDRPYHYADVVYIAEQQLALESRYENERYDWLFADTDLWVIYIWLKDKFGKVPEWLRAELKTPYYHLHLLMAPDLGWEPDPLRENPGRLEALFEQYYYELESAEHPFAIVRGRKKARFQNALSHLTHLS